MVSGRQLELKKKLPQWNSLNWHNSKYIDEESTEFGTNKLTIVYALLATFEDMRNPFLEDNGDMPTLDTNVVMSKDAI